MPFLPSKLSHSQVHLSFLQKVVVKTKNNLEKLNLDVNFLLNTNQLKDFDDFYTARMFGFSCADEYYRNVSSVNEMGNINVPLLCVSAKDDQICF